MSKHDGGIGLRSIWDIVTKDRIGNEILAVNHSEISIKESNPSVLAKIARASRQHSSITGSLANDTADAMARTGVTMHHTPREYRAENTAASDAERAKQTKAQGSVDIYTDGGTEDAAKGTPRTGWGWARYATRNKQANREPIDTGAGRLEGEQSNDLGEAMAVIQALQATHISDDATVYIDNTGVVLTTQKDTTDDPRARLKQGGRAIWNRIQLMTKAREVAGARTTFEWIHSHVDDPARRKWSQEWIFPCACEGQGKDECDPHHRHHKGNEAADAEATKGIHMQQTNPNHKSNHTLIGEEAYYLKDGSTHIQGDVWKTIEEAIERTRLQELEMRAMQQEKKKAAAWAYQTQLSDRGIRKAVASCSKETRRFTIRAWTHTLCLYKAEGKRRSIWHAT
jgi:ribonuclease HI